MRFIDAHRAWLTYPRAITKLRHPANADRLVYFDGHLYVMDDKRISYSGELWLPRSELWIAYVRRIA